jgi:hypothetical protein
MNEDGLVLALSSRKTQTVVDFFSRFARDRYGPYAKDEDELRKFAYESWALGARPDVDFNSTMESLRDLFTTIKPKPKPSAGRGSSSVVGIVIGLVAVGGIAGVGAALFRRRQQGVEARDPMLGQP